MNEMSVGKCRFEFDIWADANEILEFDVVMSWNVKWEAVNDRFRFVS